MKKILCFLNSVNFILKKKSKWHSMKNWATAFVKRLLK